MSVTYKDVCDKLGFDPKTIDPSKYYNLKPQTEDDTPSVIRKAFQKLTIEEKDVMLEGLLGKKLW